MRRATSAARLAAAITSALRPVISPPPTTNVLATGAMKPSMCTARSLRGANDREVGG